MLCERQFCCWPFPGQRADGCEVEKDPIPVPAHLEGQDATAIDQSWKDVADT